MRRVVNVIKVATVLAVMACIFYLSSQTAAESRVLSNRVVEQLKGYLALPRQWSLRRKMALVISLCFIYAITDEFHQSFVPGRAPEVRDVLIDTLGSSVGMSIGGLVKR